MCPLPIYVAILFLRELKLGLIAASSGALKARFARAFCQNCWLSKRIRRNLQKYRYIYYSRTRPLQAGNIHPSKIRPVFAVNIFREMYHCIFAGVSASIREMLNAT